MNTKNKKSPFLLIATLSGALMTGGMAFAGEEDLMVPSPEMTFGLQTQIQVALNLQIEQGFSAALAEHQVVQKFNQVYAINNHSVKKSTKVPDAEFHSQLSAGLVTANHSASQ